MVILVFGHSQLTILNLSLEWAKYGLHLHQPQLGDYT